MSGSPDLAPWLICTNTAGHAQNYRHGLIIEDPAYKDALFPCLKFFVEQVHESTRQHLRSLAGPSLDPFHTDTTTDPGFGYPEELPLRTKKGYFGEIMAGIYAEQHGPHGVSDWEVPAYPLVIHEHAFNSLEKWRRTGISPKSVVGQPGDDCLAFQRDETGRILRCLVCESKCSAGHDTSLIKDAHENLSDKMLRPVSLSKLIAILERRKEPTSAKWVEALQQFWMSEIRSDSERYDLTLYVCGQHPKDKSTWLDVKAPHPQYTGGRSIEAVEVHLNDVDSLVNALYAKNAL